VRTWLWAGRAYGALMVMVTGDMRCPLADPSPAVSARGVTRYMRDYKGESVGASSASGNSGGKLAGGSLFLVNEP
jgi:hypothetical protein